VRSSNERPRGVVGGAGLGEVSGINEQVTLLEEVGSHSEIQTIRIEVEAGGNAEYSVDEITYAR